MKQTPVRLRSRRQMPLVGSRDEQVDVRRPGPRRVRADSFGRHAHERHRIQALFFNQGDGENGKDTAFGVIAYVMGTTGRT